MTNSFLEKSRWRQWGLVFAVGTALALFFATRMYCSQLVVGMGTTWLKHLWWQAMEWYAWALLSVLIFRVCRMIHKSGGLGRQFLGQLAAGAGFVLLHMCILTTGAWIEARVLHTGASWFWLFKIVLTNFTHEEVLTYAAIVTVWHALDYHRKFREREGRAAELEAHLAQARLQALKMQLHPHFLFNTLNGIAALNYEDPQAANRMLARLGELLRLTLDDHGAPEVSLRQELEFTRRYLELEQIRLGDRLTVHLDIAPEALDAGVPNLLLQPLVENAIRHGIAPYSARGEISIHAQRNNGALHLRVADNGPGPAGNPRPSDGPGVGLKNTRARLRQLYGDAQRLELKNAEHGGGLIEITLPFRAVETADSRLEAEYEDSHTHRG